MLFCCLDVLNKNVKNYHFITFEGIMKKLRSSF